MSPTSSSPRSFDGIVHQAERTRASLDWTWTEWREWAANLVESHTDDQVADSIADMGQQMNDLRQGMAAEAVIVAAQTLSLSPRALGKGRREIVVEQVERMLGCALAQRPPRDMVRWGRSWRQRAAEFLEKRSWEET